MSFIDRIFEEQQNLQGNIDRLDHFINGEKFGDLTEKEQDLMIQQFKAMTPYNDILKLRLKFYGIKLPK